MNYSWLLKTTHLYNLSLPISCCTTREKRGKKQYFGISNNNYACGSTFITIMIMYHNRKAVSRYINFPVPESCTVCYFRTVNQNLNNQTYFLHYLLDKIKFWWYLLDDKIFGVHHNMVLIKKKKKHIHLSLLKIIALRFPMMLCCTLKPHPDSHLLWMALACSNPILIHQTYYLL